MQLVNKRSFRQILVTPDKFPNPNAQSEITRALGSIPEEAFCQQNTMHDTIKRTTKTADINHSKQSQRCVYHLQENSGNSVCKQMSTDEIGTERNAQMMQGVLGYFLTGRRQVQHVVQGKPGSSNLQGKRMPPGSRNREIEIFEVKLQRSKSKGNDF